jgi:hypothetical protein
LRIRRTVASDRRLLVLLSLLACRGATFRPLNLDEKEKVVTFLTIASTFPNSEGEVIKRNITEVTRDELTL